MNSCCPKATNCLNPIIEIYNNLTRAIASDTEAGLKSYSKGLDLGVILTHSGNLCCPDCTNPKGYYFLGKSDKFSQLLEFTQEAYPCCINHSLDSETYNKLIEDIGTNIPCCKTDFSNSISVLGSLGLNPLDIIEASSFNEHSGLMAFLEYADMENLAIANISNFLTAVLDLGLVIKCDKCNMFIGSVESYTKYIGAPAN